MLRKVLLVIVALFAVSSAWMVTSRPAASLQQCPAQAAASQPAPVFMKTVERSMDNEAIYGKVVYVDDELDNPAIAEDENIMPARKCDPTEPSARAPATSITRMSWMPVVRFYWGTRSE